MPFRKCVAILVVMQCMFVLAADAQPPAQAPPAAPAQAPAAAPAPVNPTPLPTVPGLKILVLEGQNAINSTSAHVAIQPVVEVRDQDDRPVEGASVVFRLPISGPGGTFPNNSPTETVRTDYRGQAGATGFVPNNVLGRFDIRVTATLQNLTGSITISETNSPGTVAIRPGNARKSIWHNKYLWIGAGAAVAAGVVLGLTLGHGGNKTVTITPGTVTINQ